MFLPGSITPEGTAGVFCRWGNHTVCLVASPVANLLEEAYLIQRAVLYLLASFPFIFF